MAVLPIHKYFSLNGTLSSCENFIASENEGGVYEVIRVMEGIPLFLEEHLSRFYRSAQIAGIDIPYSSDQIMNILAELILANKVGAGNVLLSIKINLKAFFIPHVYPTEEQYKAGVPCGLLHAERENPNAKVFQTDVRSRANELLSQQEIFEVLLVNHEEKITEGSRSNVFFIRGSQLITPPAGHVLLGITRQKTIHCANLLEINWKEQEIGLSELATFDSVFITGTSPKILPLNRIGDIYFDANNPVLRNLMQQFDTLIGEYLDHKK